MALDRERWRAVNMIMKMCVPEECGTCSYTLRNSDIISCFISMYDSLCCLRQNYRLMVFKQGTEANVYCSEANKPRAFNRS